MISEKVRFEPILAWRCWRLVWSERLSALRLTAIAGGGPWEPGAPAVATCRHGLGAGIDTSPHEAPGAACSCGLYAVPKRAQIPAFRSFGEPTVIGRVALWGRVVIHEQGFRAQYAYPERLGFVSRCCEPRDAGCRVARVRVVGGRLVTTVARDQPPEPTGRLLGTCRQVERLLLDTYGVDPLPRKDLPGPPFRLRGWRWPGG